MDTFTEIKELSEKFNKYRDELVHLFKEHNIMSIQQLVSNYKSNKQFKADWKKLWLDISKVEGGTLSLTTIGIILGSALGGVGIAAMGSAIGLSLVTVLGLGGMVGFLSGSKIDSLKLFGPKKRVSIELSKDLLRSIEFDAKASGVSVREYIEIVLQGAYKETPLKMN